MADIEPVKQTVKASRARQEWPRLLDQVFRRESRFLVEEDGVPVAAIISAEDLERFDRYEADRKRRLSVIDEARDAFKDVPPEEIDDEVANALAEVREERRRQHGP